MDQRAHKKGAYFALANNFWTCSLSWSVMDKPPDSPLKKTEFPSPADINYKYLLWVGVGFCIHFPVSVLGFCQVGTCVGLGSAVTFLVSSSMHSSCIWKTVFSWSHPLPLTLNNLSAVCGSLSLERKSVMRIPHLQWNVLRSWSRILIVNICVFKNIIKIY